MVCPKCSKDLGVQEKDWVKVGLVYKCKDCGLVFNVPATKLECLSCGNMFDHNDAQYREVYRYTVDADVLANAYGQIVTKHVVEVLAEKGYRVRSNAEVVSLSGARRRVPLLGEKGSQRTVLHIVFPRRGDRAQAGEDVLSACGKALDLNEKNLILAVDTPVKLPTKPGNVEIIEDKSLADLLRKLKEWPGL